ncbi:MAG: hypothetical protein ACE5KE_00565 [Methanosarcinales archaeon]
MKSKGLVVNEPCLRCGKRIRHDYNGLCMDCVDELGISEMFKVSKKKTREIIKIDMLKRNWYIQKLFPKLDIEKWVNKLW